MCRTHPTRPSLNLPDAVVARIVSFLLLRQELEEEDEQAVVPVGEGFYVPDVSPRRSRFVEKILRDAKQQISADVPAHVNESVLGVAERIMDEFFSKEGVFELPESYPQAFPPVPHQSFSNYVKVLSPDVLCMSQVCTSWRTTVSHLLNDCDMHSLSLQRVLVKKCVPRPEGFTWRTPERLLACNVRWCLLFLIVGVHVHAIQWFSSKWLWAASCWTQLAMLLCSVVVYDARAAISTGKKQFAPMTSICLHHPEATNWYCSWVVPFCRGSVGVTELGGNENQFYANAWCLEPMLVLRGRAMLGRPIVLSLTFLAATISSLTVLAATELASFSWIGCFSVIVAVCIGLEELTAHLVFTRVLKWERAPVSWTVGGAVAIFGPLFSLGMYLESGYSITLLWFLYEMTKVFIDAGNLCVGTQQFSKGGIIPVDYSSLIDAVLGKSGIREGIAGVPRGFAMIVYSAVATILFCVVAVISISQFVFSAISLVSRFMTGPIEVADIARRSCLLVCAVPLLATWNSLLGLVSWEFFQMYVVVSFLISFSVKFLATVRCYTALQTQADGKNIPHFAMRGFVQLYLGRKITETGFFEGMVQATFMLGTVLTSGKKKED